MALPYRYSTCQALAVAAQPARRMAKAALTASAREAADEPHGGSVRTSLSGRGSPRSSGTGDGKATAAEPCACVKWRPPQEDAHCSTHARTAASTPFCQLLAGNMAEAAAASSARLASLRALSRLTPSASSAASALPVLAMTEAQGGLQHAAVEAAHPHLDDPTAAAASLGVCSGYHGHSGRSQGGSDTAGGGEAR